MSQFDKTTEAKAEEEFASSIPKQLPDGTVIMPSTRLEADLDKITVRVAHDKSLYLVYHGKVPPLDGQEYISIHSHNRIVENRLWASCQAEAAAKAELLRERERSRGLVEAPGRKEKCTSDEFERRAKACGYYEAPLHQKLEYLLEVKHYSLEEGADANFELFHNVLPQVIRELAAYDASHRASAKEGEKKSAPRRILLTEKDFQCVACSASFDDLLLATRHVNSCEVASAKEGKTNG